MQLDNPFTATNPYNPLNLVRFPTEKHVCFHRDIANFGTANPQAFMTREQPDCILWGPV